MTLAWRQVLMQSHSFEPFPDCIAQPKLMDSWWCALHRVLDGAVDCANITWTLFDLSIPEWSLLFFLAVSSAMASSTAAPCLECSGTTAQRRYVADAQGRGLNTCMNFISCVP